MEAGRSASGRNARPAPAASCDAGLALASTSLGRSGSALLNAARSRAKTRRKLSRARSLTIEPEDRHKGGFQRKNHGLCQIPGRLECRYRRLRAQTMLRPEVGIARGSMIAARRETRHFAWGVSIWNILSRLFMVSKSPKPCERPLQGAACLGRWTKPGRQAVAAGNAGEPAYRCGARLFFPAAIPAPNMHVVLKGRVRLSVSNLRRPRTCRLHIAEPPSIFGEIAVFDGRTRVLPTPPRSIKL